MYLNVYKYNEHTFVRQCLKIIVIISLQVKACFRIAWQGDDESKGPAYLYLTPEDRARLGSAVRASEIITEQGDLLAVLSIYS